MSCALNKRARTDSDDRQPHGNSIQNSKLPIYLVLSSKDRQNQTSDSSFCQFNLPQPFITGVTKVELASASFPTTWYNINQGVNDTITLSYGNSYPGSGTQAIYFSYGQYAATDLVNYLNMLIANYITAKALTGSVTFSYGVPANASSNNMVGSTYGPNSFRISCTSSLTTNLYLTFGPTSPWYEFGTVSNLVTTISNTNGNFTWPFQNIVQLDQPTGLMFNINILPGQRFSGSNQTFNNQNMQFYVPLFQSNGTYLYSQKKYFEKQTLVLRNQITWNDFTVQIINADTGSPLQFNNSDWRVILKLYFGDCGCGCGGKDKEMK